MGLDFDKEIAKIIKEKKSFSPKEIYERNRLRKKEDLYVCNILNNILDKKITSIYDLVNEPKEYGDSLKYIPLLVNLIDKQQLKDDSIKEGVVRALTRKESKGLIEDVLLKEYNLLNDNEKEYLGWTIGNAIGHIYSDNLIDEILKIVKDKSNGISRQMLVLALGKTKKHKEQVESILIELTHDDDVRLHAIEALTKLKSLNAKKRIEELAQNKNKMVSKKAKLFIKKLGNESD